jgi:hypothetical protein
MGWNHERARRRQSYHTTPTTCTHRSREPVRARVVDAVASGVRRGEVTRGGGDTGGRADMHGQTRRQHAHDRRTIQLASSSCRVGSHRRLCIHPHRARSAQRSCCQSGRLATPPDPREGSGTPAHRGSRARLWLRQWFEWHHLHHVDLSKSPPPHQRWTGACRWWRWSRSQAVERLPRLTPTCTHALPPRRRQS